MVQSTLLLGQTSSSDGGPYSLPRWWRGSRERFNVYAGSPPQPGRGPDCTPRGGGTALPADNAHEGNQMPLAGRYLTTLGGVSGLCPDACDLQRLLSQGGNFATGRKWITLATLCILQDVGLLGAS